MEKGISESNGRKHGEKYQSMVDEEHHQHSLNRERLAMPSSY